MNMIVVDDERGALNLLREAIQAAAPFDHLACFQTGAEALDYVRRHLVDVAFLDIEMPVMNGVQLAGELKALRPELNIIFITGHKKYALDAFSVHACGYLLKPATQAAVREELDYLICREPLPRKRIFIRTFGSFDVLVDGKPLYFRRTKSKEILAFLVDRKGMTVTKREIASVLWEDGEYSRSRQYQLQTLLSEMVKTLKTAFADQIICKAYNSFSADISQFDCDYYLFEKGDKKAVDAYRGEYMANYSWAEETAGIIQQQYERIIKMRRR